MNRRGSIFGAQLLAVLAAGTGATAVLMAQQVTGTTIDVLVSAGIVVTLLLLILGKMIANERTMGKLEGRVEENSKRDDTQDRQVAELWAEARGTPELVRRAKHDAVNDVTGKLADMQLRYERQIEKLEERVRELELPTGKGT